LGGDEFALLVLVTSVKLPKLVAEIQKIVAAPMVLSGGETVAVSASVGVARYPQDARTAQALVAAADEAMYGGKKHR
jgi:diguanylate cyclase (GGDEF)-like protein